MHYAGSYYLLAHFPQCYTCFFQQCQNIHSKMCHCKMSVIWGPSPLAACVMSCKALTFLFLFYSDFNSNQELHQQINCNFMQCHKAVYSYLRNEHFLLFKTPLQIFGYSCLCTASLIGNNVVTLNLHVCLRLIQPLAYVLPYYLRGSRFIKLKR